MATYEFGAPLLTRKSEIATKKQTSTTLYPLEVMGNVQRLKQITVRIGFPVYRIENGRTRTFQREYLATHPDAPSDLFTLDPESLEAQRAQHQILQKLVEDEDLLSEFKNEKSHQTEPIIVTNTGVVVNGNRRLCAWRTLYYKEPEKYKYFEYVEVAVLPDDCDEAEIRALEKRLQIQKSHRAEYKWHNKAAMIKEEREANVGVDVLAKTYDISKKEVELLIGALEYAEIYLRSIGKPEQWSLVDGDEFAFKAFVDERRKIQDQGRKELFEAVCFKLIEQKDYQGRLYSIIPEIATHLDAVAEDLREKGLLPKEPSNPDTADTETELNGSDVTDDFDDLDLLGGEEMEVDANSELASKIQSSDIKLGGLVKQVVEEQKALKTEQKNAKYLVDTLSKVSKLLTNAQLSGLNENTATEGVAAQLAAIKDRIEAIEGWLKQHSN